MRSRHAAYTVLGLLAVAVAGLGLAACGGNDKTSKLSVTITEAGKKASYDVPATTDGGLVDLELQNKGKAPHGAQLVRLEGNHTAQEALKVIGSNSEKTPEWLRAEGGIGAAAPGKTAKATLNLTAGKYLVVDAGPAVNGPPAYKEFTVKGGKQGDLPSTDTTITAANPAKDKYSWQVSGPLKAGDNQVTFVSKGMEAIHLIAAIRIAKGNPTKSQIIKAFKAQGPPPGADMSSPPFFSPVIDGNKSQVTPLQLSKPGKYILFCPLSDREGGKSHFEEGMLTTVTVK